MPIVSSFCDGTPMENIPVCEITNPHAIIEIISVLVGEMGNQITYLMSDGSHSTYNVSMEEAIGAIKILNVPA